MRYYDPEVGRFVSRDPLGMWGDAAQKGNGQNYCANNPVNWVDPLGLSSPAWAGAGAGGITVSGAGGGFGAGGGISVGGRTIGKKALAEILKRIGIKLGTKFATALAAMWVPGLGALSTCYLVWEIYDNWDFIIGVIDSVLNWVASKASDGGSSTGTRTGTNTGAGGGSGGNKSGSGQPIKKGPKGGKKHKPGRGHRKNPPKKKPSKAATRKAWEAKKKAWEALTDAQRKLHGPNSPLKPGPKP